MEAKNARELGERLQRTAPATSEEVHAIRQSIEVASRGQRLDDAIALARRVVALAPDQPHHRVVLANLLIRNGDSKAARSEATLLLSCAPQELEAIRLMREAAAAEHDLPAALQWGHRLVEAAPHDVRHRYRLTNLLLFEGDLTAARAQINACLDVNSQDETAIGFLSRLEARDRQLSRQARRSTEAMRNLQGQKPDILFIGDSLIEQWLGPGREAWQKHFVPLNSANIGISGQTTRDLLRHIRQGGLCDARPDVAVLLIGTNDAARTQATHVAGRIMDVVLTLRELLPPTILLLLGLLPREAKADAQLRQAVIKINADLSRLTQQYDVLYAETGECLLSPGGILTAEISPDGLHLSSEGYARWAPILLSILRNHLHPASKMHMI